MNKVINQIKKWQPYFDAFATNKYISAMRDGLILPMYVLLFSSIFMMILYVPNIWGFVWPETIEQILLRPYDLTMGVYGLIVTTTVAKAMTDNLNREQEQGKKLSAVASMVTALSSYLILLGDPIEGGISTAYLGASGMIVGILLGLIIPNIFKFFFDRNITITLPDSVPPNLSESFKSVIAYGATITLFFLLDTFFRSFSSGMNVAEWLMNLLNPLFIAAESSIGLSFIYAATAFFQFLGMNGPDIIFPAVKPVMFQNLAHNQELYRLGQQAVHSLTNSTYDMGVAFGGTGGTMMVTMMFAFLSKSKSNKAVGRAALVPVIFNVNEPITFGVPLILNPLFLIPFILTPVANANLIKFFIEVLGMNGFIMEVPWTTPGFIGLPLGTNFHPLSFVLVALIIIVDFLIYYPFFKAYDQQMIEKEWDEEAETIVNEDEPLTIEKLNVKNDELNVLVLCAGGGTSGMLANTINKNSDQLFNQYGVKFKARGGHYGQHTEMLDDVDVVVMAPQVGSFYDTMKTEGQKFGIITLKTNGKEYIDFTRDSNKAAEFILKGVHSKEKE